jgi:hypothetical protein
MSEIKGANRFDADVVKLMRLTDNGNMLEQMFEIGLRSAVPALQEEMPEFPVEDYIDRMMTRVDYDSLLYEMVPLYSRYYTKEEIKELIDFYESPIGKKQLKITPEILNECIVINQRWIEDLVEKISDEIDNF